MRRDPGPQVIPFFAFPPDVRRLIYTTKSLESVHAQRKIIKTRGHFPTDEAAVKLLWLALRNIAKWERTAYYWRPANQFAILYEGRFTPTVRSTASHTAINRLTHEIPDTPRRLRLRTS